MTWIKGIIFGAFGLAIKAGVLHITTLSIGSELIVAGGLSRKGGDGAAMTDLIRNDHGRKTSLSARLIRALAEFCKIPYNLAPEGAVVRLLSDRIPAGIYGDAPAQFDSSFMDFAGNPTTVIRLYGLLASRVLVSLPNQQFHRILLKVGAIHFTDERFIGSLRSAASGY
jgi:hypothetical protein